LNEILTHDETAGAQPPDTEFFLATVISTSTTDGMEIQLDGEDQPMTKRFKVILVPRPIHDGERVVVMKQAGTYVILGAIGTPRSHTKIANLATSASTSLIISKINVILAALRAQGIIWT